MKADELSFGLALGASVWLGILALLSGCWGALFLIVPAVVLALVVGNGEG